MAKVGPKPIPVEQRFWRFVDVRSSNECWPWIGSKKPKGYGTINANGTNIQAHRLSYKIHKGEVPLGMFVMHSCDNPSCVNPNHLRAGSAAENTQDMINKGRMRYRPLKGHENPVTKLHELTVQRLKIVSDVIGSYRLGGLIGKSQGAIYGIMSGKTWKHLGTRQALTVEADEKR